jgi:lysine-N-methylase
VVLLNPAPIEFEERDYLDGSIRLRKVPVLDIAGIHKSEDRYEFFREVRGRVIAILQDRRYPVSERLVMLGSFCDSLDKFGKVPDRVEVPEPGTGRPAAQLEAVLELIVARISSDYTERRFLECYAEFMSGLQWTTKSTMEEIGARYGEAYLKYYAPFMCRHEHLMEHYLVNFAFRTMVPFGLPESNQRFTGGDASVRNAPYLWMVACYAITKALLIGMSVQHKLNFSLEHVVKLVQSCTKTFEHSVTFPGRALAMLRANGMHDPASVQTLIQNEAQRRRSSA